MAPPPAPPPPPPPRPEDERPAFSVEAAEAELAAMGGEERLLELELEKLYGRAAHLCQSESRSLAYVSEQHKQVPAAIRRLQETLQQTSGVADELSTRVRKLDAVCGRVVEAQKLVDDMLELKKCSDEVGKAVAAEDFETAARFVQRFRALSSGDGSTDDAAVRVLKEAEKTLQAVVRKRFDAAMAARDSAGVSRFAKLFHPLGLAGEGVKKYVEFIRRSMAEKCAADIRMLTPVAGKKADAGPAPYEKALMSVFVAIADIVQEHQQAVEEEFGPENFVVVLRGLLEEADTQGLRVMEKFFADHSKVLDANNNADTREAGAVLEETALLTQRTQQFMSYITGVSASVMELIPDLPAFLESLPQGHSKEHGLPEETQLLRRVQELVSVYVRVEERFLLQSILQAGNETDSLDTTDAETLTTTMVDDAFYILQLSVLRSITTCDINAVCAVVNHVGAAVSTEFKDVLVNNLTESKTLYGSFVGHAENLIPVPGAHPLAVLFEQVEKMPNVAMNAAVSFPHALNNLQQCGEYLDKLKEAAEENFDEYFPPDGPDKEKRIMFQHCISAFDMAKQDLEQTHTLKCKEGVTMISSHLSRELRPFFDMDYDIDEGQFEDLKVNDAWVRSFIARASLVLQHLRAVLCGPSCEECLQHLAERTCRRIESETLKKRFSLFGALQYDTEIRALVSFFTGASEQGVRHKFAKLLEMSQLLNLESSAELREICTELRGWRLQPDQMRSLILSRVDFDVTEAELEMMLPG